jgi:hypothetical protein
VPVNSALEIVVGTECDEARSGLTEAQLRALIARIGAPGDRFVVVERGSAEPDHYLQTWHESGGPYAVEFRAGAPTATSPPN